MGSGKGKNRRAMSTTVPQGHTGWEKWRDFIITSGLLDEDGPALGEYYNLPSWQKGLWNREDKLNALNQVLQDMLECGAITLPPAMVGDEIKFIYKTTYDYLGDADEDPYLVFGSAGEYRTLVMLNSGDVSMGSGDIQRVVHTILDTAQAFFDQQIYEQL